jgi:hypothetical protein
MCAGDWSRASNCREAVTTGTFISSASDKGASLSTSVSSACAQDADEQHRQASINALALNGGWHMVFSTADAPNETRLL